MALKKKSDMKPKAKPKKIDSIEELAIFVAKGFTELSSELSEFRTEVDERFEQVDIRFEQVDKHFEQVDRQFEEIKTDIRAIRRELAEIHSRIEILEEQGASQSGYAKEIDYLLSRVARIEKHLKLA